MDKRIKQVLKKLENNGFQAYVVGGFVRDFFLHIPSTDVDICTDALPKDIKEIFKINCESSVYASICFKIKNYNFEITTFRKELRYEKRKPVQIEYVNSLEEDVLRRDFTINTLCLTKKKKLIDLLNGKQDLKNKIIRLVGENEKLKEDPLRILRAIRFATVLDFSLDTNLENAIFHYKEEIKMLSKTRIKEELDKILLSKNYEKGLNLLKKFDLLDSIGIQYKKLVYVKDLCGMWAQIEIKEPFPFKKEEQKQITSIKKIVKEKKIDNFTLYQYGLYPTLIALKILKKDTNQIIKDYKKLSLKEKKDLAISVVEIKNVLQLKDIKEAKKQEQKVITKILNNELKNKKKEIVKYLEQGIER